MFTALFSASCSSAPTSSLSLSSSEDLALAAAYPLTSIVSTAARLKLIMSYPEISGLISTSGSFTFLWNESAPSMSMKRHTMSTRLFTSSYPGLLSERSMPIM